MPWLTPQSRRPTTGPDSISALVAATACLISTPHTQSGALRSDNQALGGRGWFGTVVAGFDYQFAGPFIAGVFGDGISPTFTASGKILIEKRVDRSSRTGSGLQVYAPATCSRPTCSLIWRLHAVAFFRMYTCSTSASRAGPSLTPWRRQPTMAGSSARARKRCCPRSPACRSRANIASLQTIRTALVYRFGVR